LPKGWEKVSLTTIANIDAGFAFKSKDYQDKGIPILRISNIKNGKIDFSSNTVYLDKSLQENYRDFLVKKGDIILALSGATTGKYGTCQIDDFSLLNQRVGKINSKNSTIYMQKLLLYYFGIIKPAILKKSYGMAQPNISTNELKEFLIPLPPLNEQKRIVEKIEELFSIIDNVEQIITKLLNKITKLIQKIIDEFTSTKNVNLEVEEYLLGDIADIKGGITLGRKLTGKTIKLPYLRVANVQDGYLDLEQIKQINIKNTERDKWLLFSGDILLTEGGDRDKLGRGTVWREQIPNCIHQNHIFRVRLDQTKFVPDYISMILRSSQSKQYFQKKGKQSVNLASINKTQLSSFKFSCPDVNIQKKRYKIIQNAIDNLSKQQENARKLIEDISRLRIQILSYGFEGKLVPQDPNDEPASVLLERIKQEKEQLKLKEKSKKRKKNGR